MVPVNTSKLALLAILGFCAVLLGSAVLTVQLRVLQQRQRMGLRRTPPGISSTSDYDPRTNRNGENVHDHDIDSTSTKRSSRTTTRSTVTTTTTRSSQPLTPQDKHLEQSFPPPDASSWKTAANAYWYQTTLALQDWDAILSSSPPLHPVQQQQQQQQQQSSTDARLSLQQAAHAGHPMAQLYLANAMASGIWPMTVASESSPPPPPPPAQNAQPSLLSTLQVLDDWNIPVQSTGVQLSSSGHEHESAKEPSHQHGTIPEDTDQQNQKQIQRQLTNAMLLWHMAAIGGNVEAAMAMAYRLNATILRNENPNPTTSTPRAGAQQQQLEEERCWKVLPYYEAAAHGVMDALETNEHSRAKVRPRLDRHSLATVHIHGGTSSQLDMENKPDESKDAIQFYHLHASMSPFYSRVVDRIEQRRQSQSNHGPTHDDSVKSSNGSFYKGENSVSNLAKEAHKVEKEQGQVSRDIDSAVKAADTLASLYHFGVRGVEQNLTQALIYYELMGIHQRWDAAGEAGLFHLWGMGVPQNVHDALQFFRIGAPVGIQECHRRYNQKLLKEQKSTDPSYFGDIHVCDDTSLNGMGLLHLMGVPGKIAVDLETAEKYFVLAKEMGNVDAMYNLAMIWLGWRTHFKHVDDLNDNGMSTDSGLDPTSVFPGDLDSNNNNNNKAHDRPTANYALYYSKRSLTDKHYKGPVKSEIQDAVSLLVSAANKGHLQARHRLALIYSEGIHIRTAALKYDAVKPDCEVAKRQYQWIAENANPILALRLRKAYKDYMDGNMEASLRNYLAAAETGSDVGQVNAAFLLERGTCLGLSQADCAKASVRLWKAAAARGNAEACLRVGDFYYYGRLRGYSLPVGPFAWVQYLLYPEEYLPELLKQWVIKLWPISSSSSSSSSKNTSDDERRNNHEQELVELDLTMAAHYYNEAVEKHSSPRANFNLGFMYEWGLGLTQDFPLAKRHYDLAKSLSKSGEADLAVQLALTAMSYHDFLVRVELAWNEWWWKKGSRKATKSRKVSNSHTADDGTSLSSSSPDPLSNSDQPIARSTAGVSNSSGKTVQSIVLSHIFNWSSLLIIVLLYAVLHLMKTRQRQGRR